MEKSIRRRSRALTALSRDLQTEIIQSAFSTSIRARRITRENEFLEKTYKAVEKIVAMAK